MQFHSTLSFGIFLIALVASRFVIEAATRRLVPEHKAALFDEFSTARQISTAILAGGVVAAFFYPVLVFPVFVSYYLGVTAVAYPKLRRLGFPPAYRRSYVVANLIVVFGAVVAGCILLWAATLEAA